MTYRPPNDRDIGRNLKRLRQSAGMSQTALAERLIEMGLPFSQQTILKVEKGSRSLKLAEGHAIAEILNITGGFLTAVEVSHEEMTAYGLDRRVAAAHHELVRRVFEFRKAIEELREYLSTSGITEAEIEGAVRPWRRRMLDLSLPRIVEAILEPDVARKLGLIAMVQRASDAPQGPAQDG